MRSGGRQGRERHGYGLSTHEYRYGLVPGLTPEIIVHVWSPDMASHGLGHPCMVINPSTDSSAFVLMYHGSGLLLHHLQSIHSMSDQCDLPDSASTWPSDLVSPCDWHLLDCVSVILDNMVGWNRYEVVCGAWEVVCMVQVHCSLCHGAAHADSPGTQLVHLFQLVSSHSMLRLLCHPFPTISCHIWHHQHHFGASNCTWCRPSPLVALWVSWFFISM